MNPSKSTFQGPILTISISADREYRYDDSSTSFAFRCDGKDRSIRENRTLACIASSAVVTATYYIETAADDVRVAMEKLARNVPLTMLQDTSGTVNHDSHAVPSTLN